MKPIIRSLFQIQLLLLLNWNYIFAQTFDWAKSPVSSKGGIVGLNISVDAKGNSFVTGDSYGTVSFDTAQFVGFDGIDIFLAKYDPNGKCIWAKHAGGNYQDYDPWGDYGRGTSIDSKGNCYVVGYFQGDAFFDSIQLSPYGSEDIFIAKYDANGNCLWAKHAGGIGYDYGYGITVDAEGNSYITGSFSGTASFDTYQLTSNGYEDIFVAKYNTYGNCLWVKHAGGNSRDVGNSISLDAYGDSYITGLVYDTAIFDSIQFPGNGGFIAKYDPNGNCQWVNKCGNDLGNCISVDTNGNSYVTGDFWNDAKFGSIELTGYGGFDIFIAKYDPKGNCLWAKDAGGSDWDIGYGISVDHKGNCYATGYFIGIAAFDSISVTSSAQNNVFFAKYDSNGNCLWVKQAGGTEGAIGYSVTNDGNGNIFSTGWFQKNAVFGTIQLYGTAYITKLSDVPLPVELSSFTSKTINNSVKLEWTTQTETNNSRFEIERKNPNSIWNKIGDIKGAGTSTSPKQYSFIDKSVIQSGKYYYRLKHIDYNGQYKYSNELEVNYSIPEKYSLGQNYPSPFNPNTTIAYTLKDKGFVKLKVFDVRGELVRVLVNESKDAGYYETEFSGKGLASGVYIYRIEVIGNGNRLVYSDVKKTLLLK